MKYVFDTNAVINFVCDTGDFSNLRESDEYYISFVSFIELSVGFKSKDEEQITKSFIDKANLVLINKNIIDKTIDIRKSYGLKLPDSIIIATAIQESATLITSDMQIMKKAPDMNIKIIDPLSGESIM